MDGRDVQAPTFGVYRTVGHSTCMNLRAKNEVDSGAVGFAPNPANLTVCPSVVGGHSATDRTFQTLLQNLFIIRPNLE